VIPWGLILKFAKPIAVLGALFALVFAVSAGAKSIRTAYAKAKQVDAMKEVIKVKDQQIEELRGQIDSTNFELSRCQETVSEMQALSYKVDRSNAQLGAILNEIGGLEIDAGDLPPDCQEAVRDAAIRLQGFVLAVGY
jgi:septal ring factor EnvC (AmiA/AmiB activator)